MLPAIRMDAHSGLFGAKKRARQNQIPESSGDVHPWGRAIREKGDSKAEAWFNKFGCRLRRPGFLVGKLLEEKSQPTRQSPIFAA